MIARYTRKPLAELWSDPARFRRWRDIELYALEAMVDAGLAPSQALADCRGRAGDFDQQDVQRIDEIEKTTRHDVIAFLTFLEGRIGPSARWLHLGMTSSDVLDTALAVALKEATGQILQGLSLALEAIERRSREHRKTPMIGRSHGIHAEPTTFGHKLAVWYAELERAKSRLLRAQEAVSVGKISGAVGTFAHLPPSVEAHVCGKLGLRPAPVSTQVIQRDRHAELFCALALVGSSIEKFAVEIRHLQRTEVREVEEPFAEGQKGSSAMPHKRNPILSENLTGLARLLRGHAVSAMEDIPLWHERDISHSSVERVIAPDATGICDFMVHRFANLVADLRVYPERMRRNLDLLGGLIHSQTVLLALAKKGVERQQAYTWVQRNAMKAIDRGEDFKRLLLSDQDLARHLSADEIEGCFDESAHFRHVDEIFARVFKGTPSP